MFKVLNSIILIPLCALSASCAVKYIEPARDGNSVIRFINQNSSVTIFYDAAVCTGLMMNLHGLNLLLSLIKI